MVIFVGGIHGSGKGTICKQLANQINYVHLTASKLLKWNEVSPDTKNKFVKDIADTQDRLIHGLEEAKRKNRQIILDGHYCLFNANGVPERVPISTFEKINPKVLSIVYAEPVEILKRLHNRDSKKYSLDVIEKMQRLELRCAEEVALYLRIPLVKINSEETNNLKELISLIK